MVKTRSGTLPISLLLISRLKVRFLPRSPNLFQQLAIPERFHSSAIDQDAECAGNRRPLRPGPLCGRLCRRTKISSIHEEMVRLAVQSHGLCSEFGLDGFDLTEFIRRVFME